MSDLESFNRDLYNFQFDLVSMSTHIILAGFWKLPPREIQPLNELNGRRNIKK